MNTPANYLGVRALAAITTFASLLIGTAYLIEGRVDIELSVWCDAAMGIGPFGCLFLAGLLLAAFFREGRRHRLAFGLGLAAGLAPIALLWGYASVH